MPLTTRGLDSPDTIDVSESLQSRDFGLLDILGKKWESIQPQCVNETGHPSVLHDEFVWPEYVVGIGSELCTNATDFIDATGLVQDGGIAYASKELANAFDEQSS